MFGLFSAFNVDAIRTISFWKDDFPARYGGRLSSVLDLKMKEGDKQQFRAEGGIGLTSARLTAEGPIAKNKASFMVSGRRSYINLIMKPLMPENEKLGYHFYDLNVKANWKVNEKNQLYASSYFANDLLSEKDIVKRASFRREMHDKLNWGNATATLRWNHQLGSRGFINTTFYHSQYMFSVNSSEQRTTDSTNNTERLDFKSWLWDYSLKADLDYYLSNRHTLNAGGNGFYTVSAPVTTTRKVRSADSEQPLVNLNETRKLRFTQKTGSFRTNTGKYIRYSPDRMGGRKAEVKGKAMFSIVPSVSYNFRIH